jgi:hypothetical protein
VRRTARRSLVERGVDLVEHAEAARLARKIAMSSATAVRVFSPPESWLIERGSLPGGLAMTSTPDSSRSVSSVTTLRTPSVLDLLDEGP